MASIGCSRKVATAQDELDRKFEEMMKGVTLVGRSTRLSDDKVVGEEKYVIEGISKMAGDTWLFRARLQYGGRDIPVPLPVTIKWAGDTPVITLTDLSIPGIGNLHGPRPPLPRPVRWHLERQKRRWADLWEDNPQPIDMAHFCNS